MTHEFTQASRRDFLKSAGALIVGFSMGGGDEAGRAEPDQSDRTGGRDAGRFLDLDRRGREHHRLLGQDRVRTGLFHRANPVGRRGALRSAQPHQGHLRRHRFHSRSGRHFRQPVHRHRIQARRLASGPGHRPRRVVPTGVAATRCPDEPAHRSGRRVLGHGRRSVQPGELRSIAPGQAIQSHC